ncbi:tripartite tricarboxylate transporter substrate binding protein [Roseomonas terrae]|jgi:tripartite-type tricarboxylate transporter receptor subunit TctC|uniref:Tripartite tricarboxylate transporter substrate binding protein n=1 Tax=Neoroseomonas terrae TaxID=424799 RepID=A0ABS5EEV3_9PROT|nr:tripartite tricarboxylate transporter substrate binding protein [Neoroseomonas terrae]MBR0649197.1 tripartite tricarboxylate transporter substrate binding protein [Neoroseomonas terrae]
MITRRLAVSALALPALIGRAQAQAFPDQPIRLIVPFAPGGPADLIARTVGRSMGEKLGKPVVVEARAGAGGLIGVDYVAKARPDGHTLVLASSGAMAVLPHLQPNMPFDPRTDLSPITQVLAVPQIVSSAPNLGPKSLAELVAMAKARPGQLTYGSAGIGSSLHLAGELLKLRAGIDIVHVPFRGAAPAVTELLAGRIQILLADVPALISHVRGGAVPALAITSPQRLSIMPDVPTAEEAGVPGLISETWYGVLGPAGIPADRLAILSAATKAALDDPETRRVLSEQGGRIVASNPDEFATFIRAAYDQWGEVVRATGMRLE